MTNANKTCTLRHTFVYDYFGGTNICGSPERPSERLQSDPKGGDVFEPVSFFSSLTWRRVPLGYKGSQSGGLQG